MKRKKQTCKDKAKSKAFGRMSRELRDELNKMPVCKEMEGKHDTSTN